MCCPYFPWGPSCDRFSVSPLSLVLMPVFLFWLLFPASSYTLWVWVERHIAGQSGWPLLCSKVSTHPPLLGLCLLGVCISLVQSGAVGQACRRCGLPRALEMPDSHWDGVLAWAHWLRVPLWEADLQAGVRVLCRQHWSLAALPHANACVCVWLQGRERERSLVFRPSLRGRQAPSAWSPGLGFTSVSALFWKPCCPRQLRPPGAPSSPAAPHPTFSNWRKPCCWTLLSAYVVFDDVCPNEQLPLACFSLQNAVSLNFRLVVCSVTSVFWKIQGKYTVSCCPMFHLL